MFIAIKHLVRIFIYLKFGILELFVLKIEKENKIILEV